MNQLEREYQEYLSILRKAESPVVRAGALTFEEWKGVRGELKDLNRLICG